MKRLLAWLLLMSSLAMGQALTPNINLRKPVIGSAGWGTHLNNNFDDLDGYLSGGRIAPALATNQLVLTAYTVATLPAPASTTVGAIRVVNDANVAGSCVAGGGTDIALCRNNGSAWVSLGGGGGGGGGGYSTIQEEGSSLTARTIFNFIGAALTAADNAGSTRTDITLSQSPAGATSVVGTTRTLTGGAGIAALGDLSADRTVATASGETDFLASGALSCGAGTQGRTQVHTTPLQYCDNAGTPTLRYAAYGDSAGAASSLTSTSSATFATYISDETGSGLLVFATSPTLTTPVLGAATATSIAFGADPADAGELRLPNAGVIAWEASPAGTDVTLTVDASEIMQASSTFNAAILTEGGVDVPNTGNHLGVFAATTSAQLAGVISDETGSGVLVFGTTPTIATPLLTGKIDRNNVAVDDDDCTGEQGLYWYDTTDLAFEFCNANTGTPAVIVSTGMASFTISGDGGSDQTITDANVLEINAGTPGLITTGAATDILQISFNYLRTTDDPAMGVSSCVFGLEAGSGGSILCEGTVANLNEQLFKFPTADGVDTVSFIVVDESQVTDVDGVGLEIVGGVLAFTSAETTNLTWSAGGSATFTHTYNVSTGTDPVITFGNGTINVSTGALQEGGNAVPNATDHLGFFAATTSAQLRSVLSDESGSTGVIPVFSLTSLTIGDFSCWDGNNWVNCVSGVPINAQTGTSYTVVTGDRGKFVTHSNAGAIAVTLPQAGSAGFASNFFYYTINLGAGAVTITPTTSTIDGAATKVLSQNECAFIFSDNTNYRTLNMLRCDGGLYTAAELATDSVSSDELNATGVESELEAVLDLADLQEKDIDSLTGQANWGTAATKETTDLTISGVEVDFEAGAAEGYPRLAQSTTPPAGDCDAAGEAGRLYFDSDADTNGSVFICLGVGGWKDIDDDGAGGGAPTDTQYVVGAADATLTAEKILTDGQGIDTVLSGADAGAATIDLKYTDTLAGNPAFDAGEAVFTDDCTGGGFLSEGTTANTNEMLFCLPALDEADTTHTLVTTTATQTLTEKTLNVESSGNVVTTVSFHEQAAATCVGGTATNNWDDSPLLTEPAAACIAGTNQTYGVSDFDAATDEGYQISLRLPADWTGNVDVDIFWHAAATTGSVIWVVETICRADGEAIDNAFTGSPSSVTDAAKGTANQLNTAGISTLVVTGCAADELLFVQVSRDANNVSDDMTGDARLKSVRFKMRRAQ